jgi:hypothetical protein
MLATSFSSCFIRVTLLLTALSGCSTQKAASSPPVNDIAELRLSVANARKALEPTLHTLDLLGNFNGPCPPQVLVQFSADIQRLEVDSLNFRAHAQAMQTIGEPYFEEWEGHLATANDPEVRQFATERHALLEDRFTTIREATQRTGAQQRSFISNIRILRSALEKESATNLSASTKDLIRKTREDGRQLHQQFEGLERELDLVIENLTPKKAATQK